MAKITKNTLGMFDCLKGAIVIWVILFHSFSEVWGVNNCTEYSLLWKVIYASSGIAMAVFFVISGYGFRPLKSRRAIMNQIKLLLKPYAVVYLCCILVRIPLNIISGRAAFEGALERILGFLLGKMGSFDIGGVETESVFVFWYFLALFWGWMILSIIVRYCKQELSRIVAVAACVIVGYFMALKIPNIPYCIIPSFLSVGFLYFGYILKKKGALFVKIEWWKYMILWMVTLFVIKCGAVNISTGYMRLGMIDYIGTLCGAFVVVRIYLFLFNPAQRIYNPLMFYGRNSSLFICIHGFEHLVAQWRTCPYLVTNHPHITAIIFFVFRMFLILLIYYFVVWIKKQFSKIHSRKAKV